MLKRAIAILTLTLAACSGDLLPPHSPPSSKPATGALALAFLGPIDDGVAGLPIGPVFVGATRSSGDIDVGFIGNITITLQIDGHTAELTGTTTAPAKDGIAVFSDLRIGLSGGAYQWRAESGGLRSATSGAFAVRAVVPQLAFGGCIAWDWDEFFDDICIKSGLTILNPDGTERVLELPTGGISDPAWSPDGTRIAFTGYLHCGSSTTGSCYPSIYTMNRDGSGITRLTALDSVSSYAPAWSPDGSRLAFNTWDSRVGPAVAERLHIVNADGTGQAPLGDLVGNTPAWSPDGSRIAYAGYEGSGHWAIHVAMADGSGRIQLTDPAGLAGDPASDWRPAWSPDGSRIAFTRTWQHPSGNGSCQVLVMNSGGSGVVQLTQDSFCAGAPAWSPDGARIAFLGTEGRRSAIKFMNPDGTDLLIRRWLIEPGSRVTWAPVH